jgi:hypothetical protein
MRVHSFVATMVVASLIGALPLTTFGDAPSSMRPGALGGGVTLLPNGWKIAPAGQHVQVGSFPLAMVESPDGRYLFITNNGYLNASITVVDIKARRVTDTLVLDHAWLGLAWHPDGKRLYASGAGNSTVHELRWERRLLPPVPEEGVTPPETKDPAEAFHGRPVARRGLRHARTCRWGQINRSGAPGRRIWGPPRTGKSVFHTNC